MAIDPHRARLLLLATEIRADLTALEHHGLAIAAALARTPWAEEDPQLAVVALAMHHAYSAAESAMERIANAFEGLPDRGDRWHQDLLSQMSLGIPEVREPVLSAATVKLLRPALQFRHFLRHAYAVALEPTRLRGVAEETLAAQRAVQAELAAFADALTAAARAS